jgi:hypothetical protein
MDKNNWLIHIYLPTFQKFNPLVEQETTVTRPQI